MVSWFFFSIGGVNMLDNNSESAVFDTFSTTKDLQLQEFHHAWDNPCEKKEPLIFDTSTVATNTWMGYKEAYNHNLKPLTEEEFCDVMSKMPKDSNDNDKTDIDPPYTTIFGPGKKQTNNDIKQPPVTSIIPNDEIFNMIQMDKYAFGPSIPLICDDKKLHEPFRLEVEGFDKHKIRFDDQAHIPIDKSFIKPTADTLDKKWVPINTIGTDTITFNNISIVNNDIKQSYFSPFSQYKSYRPYELINESIGPFHSTKELMDYIMNHIDKFDNETLDRLIYGIAQEKIHRIEDTEDNTKK